MVAGAPLQLDPQVRSHVGRRANNEDAWLASPRLVAIADGVGGAAAGEVASRTVINALAHLEKCRLGEPLAQALPAAVAHGNETLAFIVRCRPELDGMSTTLSAVALDNDGAYVVANIGDSRTYLLRDGELRPLTRDDSFVQELLERGDLTPQEALRHPQRSLVLRALDGGADRAPAVSSVPARAGDRLLVCSDGLSDVLGADAIAALLGAGAPRRAADALVAAALHAGARDNVSVIVADAVPRRDPAAAWQPPLAA